MTMTKKRRRKRSRPESSVVTNPLLDSQSRFLKTLTKEELHGFFSSSLPPERRAELWMEQADLGETLVNEYSWATPDERALNILKHFGPIVEVGCGSNAYWCRCMGEAGIDVVGYDVQPQSGGKITEQGRKHKGTESTTQFIVRHGGPEVLSSNEIRDSKRTLFLCYPDENDQPATDGDDVEIPLSLGAACLEHYEGKYVIHVGELYGDTPSFDQAPWGRSSSSEFQQRLAAEYHCLLKASLINWLHVRDTISVWKRSEKCSIIFAAEDENDEDEEVEYTHVPVEERLPLDIAAPKLKHLLTCAEAQKPDMIKPPTEKAKRRATQNEVTKASESTEPASEDYSCPW